MTFLNYLLGLSHQYPELVALGLGSLLSWAPGLVLETWFLPESWPDRKMKQVTLGVTMLVAFTASHVLWRVLDPADTASTVNLISLIAALSAPMVHVMVAKILTHYFPYLDSVFQFKPKNVLPPA